MTDNHHPAGFATYPGDCRHITGEVKGPTTYGTHVFAAAAQYDPDRDTTRVAFAHCRPEDLDTLVRVEGVLRFPAAEVRGDG